MLENNNKYFSKCQDALKIRGHFETKFKLPKVLENYIEEKNYLEIDQVFQNLCAPQGALFLYLSQFESFSSMEFMISLREAKNEWEEDGIWHDDGSRKLAFSLSLTMSEVEGGILEIRKKGSKNSYNIPTPEYGHMIIFATGRDQYEHKINKVTKGSRLIIAGWCS